MSVDFDDVRAAAARIAGFAHRTPTLTCRAVDERLGMEVAFKCEGFQKVGAFKYRGATNAVLQLSVEAAGRGVLTHSSGNHAQALALAARERGIPAWIVMPENAPAIKRAAVEGYGATVVTCAPTLEAREATAARVARETGATFVHPYDDDRIIAGQGTAALELLQDHPDLEAVIAPVGGGGLLAGTCVAVHGHSPDVRVFAGEPELADDALRSLEQGVVLAPSSPVTIADGLRTALSERTFGIIREHVEQIVPVAEDAILDWTRFLMERMKIVVEPSAAVPAAALEAQGGLLEGARVGVILSGANLDLDVFCS